jgi:hypothetical protein
MSEDRALAGYIVLEFALVLVLLSLLWGVLNEVVLQLEVIDLGIISETNPTVAAQQYERGEFFISQAWEYTPVWGAVLVTLALQVAAKLTGGPA